jgi:hypothetical protein
MVKKILIDNARRKALILSLGAGVLTLDAFPEVVSQVPKMVAWGEFWRNIAGTNEPVGIPLNRNDKIAVLQSIHRGYLCPSDFNEMVWTESRREPFLELMIAATFTGTDNGDNS